MEAGVERGAGVCAQLPLSAAELLLVLSPQRLSQPCCEKQAETGAGTQVEPPGHTDHALSGSTA